jgi:GT2 family glycosyltransferase
VEQRQRGAADAERSSVNRRAGALSVVICAYTDERWSDLQDAVASVRAQQPAPAQIVVVIDHNDGLLARARDALEGVTVVANAEARGLSGARNTGIQHASGEIVAFLDDDATALAGWTAHLLAPYADPDVLAVGGRVVPRWDDARPRWLPPEFDWVVGCTYAGHRETAGPVRNLIGANMSVRREVVDAVGGFRHSLGRTASLPAGCEETELFIRATQRFPTGRVWYEPDAVVSHRVPVARATRRYFRARCYAEGISKTYVSRLVGSRDGLASERAYTTRALPRALLRELSGARRDRAGAARAVTLVAGVATTGAGFVAARIPRPSPAPAPGTLRALPPDGATAVVVATRDRPEQLERCLQSLRALDPPPAQIVVVDNGSRGPETADLLARLRRDDTRFEYVHEDRPGLARAHNRALEIVRTPYVAFTDDDVVVDRSWLGRLRDGFRRDPAVACVTGMIRPLEIETAAQEWMEQYAGFAKGEAPLLFDSSRVASDPLFPYAAGSFGSGANMAFRTDVLRAIRGFDPALGAGTTARGGDDLAAFFDVIAAGYAIAYEPAAVVLHEHHRTFAALRRQTFGYGAGLTAYLTKTVLDHPGRILDLAHRVPSGLRHGLSRRSPKNQRLPEATPPALVRRERLGMLAGPFLYLRSRLAARNDPRPGPLEVPAVADVPIPDVIVLDESPAPAVPAAGRSNALVGAGPDGARGATRARRAGAGYARTPLGGRMSAGGVQPPGPPLGR